MANVTWRSTVMDFMQNVQLIVSTRGVCVVRRVECATLRNAVMASTVTVLLISASQLVFHVALQLVHAMLLKCAQD